MAASVGPNHWWTSFVGNVLGYDGQTPLRHPRSEGQGGYDAFVYERTAGQTDQVAPMWSVGWGDDGAQEPRTVATLIRHGNFDYVTRGAVRDPGNAIRVLPTSLW